MTSITTPSKDTWSLFLLVIAIAIAIAGTIYIVPRLGDESWDKFTTQCSADNGTINAANQCIVPVTDRIYISRSITGVETYCTLPTRACGHIDP